MEDPVTDGSYLGLQAVAPFPGDFISAQHGALEQAPAVSRAIDGIDRPISRNVLVGAGGSLFGLVPAHYLLERSGSAPVASLNSDEFFYRASPGVGRDTLVVLLSGKGKTPETIRAANWARSRGAAVVGVTLDLASTFAASVDLPFAAASGPGNQILLQLLALALLDREGVDTAAQRAALQGLPEALLAALQHHEERSREIAVALQDLPVTHVIASGPLVGAAATFTSCYLQEMQWMHAMTINADEFFQGPFEVVDRRTRMIVYLGEDETRPVGERVRRFLDTYGGPTFYIDGRDFPLPGIAPAQRGYVLPLVFHGLAARLAAHYASVRGFALEGRRYMWKVDY
jgi:fructoselysine-6-P-deglycase FrlB-like protein